MVCRRRSLRKRAAQTQIINQDAGRVQAGVAGLGTVTPGSLHQSTAGGAARACPGNGAYGGMQSGDYVGNIRLDQTWGSAQVMAAAHELNAGVLRQSAAGADATPGAGHPSNQWGYAVGAGLRLNFPMIAQGDYFQSQVNYTQGALRYLFFTPNTNWGKVEGTNETFGVLSDCVYGGDTGRGGDDDDRLSADHGLGLQRVLRTLLDSCGP